MTDWQLLRLGDALSVSHGFAFKGEFFCEYGDLIVLTPGNFRDEGGFKPKGGKEKFYEGPFPERFLLKKSQVVVAMTEQSKGLLGSSATIPTNDKYLHNQRIGLLNITDPCRLDLRFAYHLLNAPFVRQQIQATATGSKVRHTAPNRIEAIVAPVPDIECQHRIARALDDVDNLVENNRRRIEVLEEMARLLYREWFVHFRFPGHEDVGLIDSDLGPIPEEWEAGKFADLVLEVSESVGPDEIAEGTPVVGLEHFPRRSTTLHVWDSAHDVGSRRKVFDEGDILFGKIRPYFHKVVDAPTFGCCSTDAIVFRPIEKTFQSRALAIASSDEFVGVATATSNGTKMPRANTKILLGYGIPHPTRAVELAFSGAVGPMNYLRKNFAAQNRLLREARDLLLPLLVSGELDITKLELGLEAVGA
ncbi:MAG: restriction endonuclease subunit S [Acidimicrobiia bacterium]|nr:restriction endonuclease subunit S [Acidimicrobiia bacterium]